MAYPTGQKIYHILHYDRIPSLLKGGFLFSDKYVRENGLQGTNIGYQHLKDRRLITPLQSHPELTVGACVPFYYCPRSAMLYTINIQSKYNDFEGGQNPIVHLEFDLTKAMLWSQENKLRWAGTTLNAGARHFEDFSSIDQFNRINWDVVGAQYWSAHRDLKAAEFLVEYCFPFSLVETLGINNNPRSTLGQHLASVLAKTQYAPLIKIKPDWYY